jgi:hypothetical protein
VRTLGRSKKEAERESHMKHRIQNLESRIQKANGFVAPAAERLGSRPGMEGCDAVYPAEGGNEDALKREETVGIGGFCRIIEDFYRLATGFSHLRAVLIRLLPCKSTQVVDFPHLAMARLFSRGWKTVFQAKFAHTKEPVHHIIWS